MSKKKFCDNYLCESEATVTVPVSEDQAFDSTRNFCAVCHEAYTIGCQHGRRRETSVIRHEQDVDTAREPDTAKTVLVVCHRPGDRIRYLQPIRLVWGSTEEYSREQWLLIALDRVSRKLRHFALSECDFHVHDPIMSLKEMNRAIKGLRLIHKLKEE